jgi:hypothetical protein
MLADRGWIVTEQGCELVNAHLARLDLLCEGVPEEV